MTESLERRADDGRLTDIQNEIRDQGRRLTAIEARLAAFAPLEAAHKMEIAITKMESTVTVLTGDMTELATQIRSLFGMHEKLLTDRAAHDKELHEKELAAIESRLLVNQIKNNWAVLAGFTVSLIALSAALLKGLEVLLAGH